MAKSGKKKSTTKEVIAYLVCGVLTTVVNVAVYHILFKLGCGVPQGEVDKVVLLRYVSNKGTHIFSFYQKLLAMNVMIIPRRKKALFRKGPHISLAHHYARIANAGILHMFAPGYMLPLARKRDYRP